MARARKSSAVARIPDSAAAPAMPEPVIDLGKTCGIREGASLKQQLLAVLEAADPVAIDPTAIERIDTAALQLLFAFERDRAAAGRSVAWRAPSAAFAQAAATLGLRLGGNAAAAQ